MNKIDLENWAYKNYKDFNYKYNEYAKYIAEIFPQNEKDFEQYTQKEQELLMCLGNASMMMNVALDEIKKLKDRYTKFVEDNKKPSKIEKSGNGYVYSMPQSLIDAFGK